MCVCETKVFFCLKNVNYFNFKLVRNNYKGWIIVCFLDKTNNIFSHRQYRVQNGI